MQSLPLKAKIYMFGIYAAGAAAVYAATVSPFPVTDVKLWELGFFVVLAALAGGKKIRLMRHTGAEDVSSMSLGFAITFAAMLYFGPAGGLLMGVVSCLSGCLFPKRQRVFQLVFNVAITAVESWLAGQVYLAMNEHSLLLRPVESFPAVVTSCLTYFAVNTGGVAAIIALCTDQSIPRLWRQTFLWTAPSYFAGACVAAIAMFVFGRHVGTALLFGSPIAYLTYQSYAIYTARAEEKQQHIEELQVSQAQLADLYLATIKSLALAIDAKDQYTHQHILRVQRYAIGTAQQMGLSGAELEGVKTGALLHDIGKLGVPEYVLLKPGRLTDEEFAKIKKHPEIGAAILDPVDFPWPVVPVVKHHHEKWDGSGYPDGLHGEDIPLMARILAVADVYDALTSTRSYRKAWSHEKAIETITADAGKHFDPQVVEAFLQVIGGIVEELAEEGEGPLAVKAASAASLTKADEAVQHIQRASSELWALYEVAQTLSSSLGTQETLDILARKLEGILPGAACLFLLRDERGGGLVARAAVGVNREYFDGCRTLTDNSLSYLVAQRRTTYVGEYDSDDLLVNSSQSAQWTPIKTALIVPIVHQGEMLGTINLYHPSENAFGQHDRQLLETIAERAAMALFNGMLFDRTRSHALTDPLTGLYNVRYLTQHVDERCQALEAASEGGIGTAGFTLLCLDLDSFKPINDNFGHQKGDQVLRELGKIFRATVGKAGVVARYGGDEFVIVLDGVGASEARSMAERLTEAVMLYDPGLVHAKLGDLHLGASVGWACYPDDGRDCATLMAAADSHMYRHKTERKLGSLANRRGTRADELPRAA